MNAPISWTVGSLPYRRGTDANSLMSFQVIHLSRIKVVVLRNLRQPAALHVLTHELRGELLRFVCLHKKAAVEREAVSVQLAPRSL